MSSDSNNESLIKLAAMLRKQIRTDYAKLGLAMVAAAIFLMFGFKPPRPDLATAIINFIASGFTFAYSINIIGDIKIACLDYSKLPIEVMMMSSQTNTDMTSAS